MPSKMTTSASVLATRKVFVESVMIISWFRTVSIAVSITLGARVREQFSGANLASARGKSCTSEENLKNRAERIAVQLEASELVATAQAVEDETYLGETKIRCTARVAHQIDVQQEKLVECDRLQVLKRFSDEEKIFLK